MTQVGRSVTRNPLYRRKHQMLTCYDEDTPTIHIAFEILDNADSFRWYLSFHACMHLKIIPRSIRRNIPTSPLANLLKAFVAITNLMNIMEARAAVSRFAEIPSLSSRRYVHGVLHGNSR